MADKTQTALRKILKRLVFGSDTVNAERVPLRSGPIHSLSEMPEDVLHIRVPDAGSLDIKQVEQLLSSPSTEAVVVRRKGVYKGEDKPDELRVYFHPKIERQSNPAGYDTQGKPRTNLFSPDASRIQEKHPIDFAVPDEEVRAADIQGRIDKLIGRSQELANKGVHNWTPNEQRESIDIREALTNLGKEYDDFKQSSSKFTDYSRSGNAQTPHEPISVNDPMRANYTAQKLSAAKDAEDFLRNPAIIAGLLRTMSPGEQRFRQHMVQGGVTGMMPGVENVPGMDILSVLEQALSGGADTRPVSEVQRQGQAIQSTGGNGVGGGMGRDEWLMRMLAGRGGAQ